MKYQTYKYNDNNEIVVVGNFDSLIDAYTSIENSGMVLLTDFFINEFNKLETIDSFLTDYNVTLDEIIREFGVIRRDTPFNNLKKVYVLMVNNHLYLVTDNEYYLADLNNILEEELQSEIYIRKNPDEIADSLKFYFKNHVVDFLNVVDTLIVYDYYQNYKWRKRSNTTFTLLNTEDDTTVNIQYDENYNEKDAYVQIVHDTLYSSTEINVINDFMQDLDLIVSIFIENKDLIKTLNNVSADFAQIVRYL